MVQDVSPLLDAVLEISDSSLTYRRRYLTQLEVPAVVDLIITDETNPRAAAFQVAALEKHLNELPHDSSHPQRHLDRQAAMKLRTQLTLADVRLTCQPDKRGTRPALDQLTTDIIDGMGKISELVSQVYFSHAAISRSLPGLGEERVK